MTTASVILWGTQIGTVAYDDESGYCSFEYDRDFISSGIEVSPIAMPLSRDVYAFPELPYQSFHGLPGLLADSLPDKFGNAVIDAWLESQGRNPGSLNPVERLCYTGSRGMGALEYVPARGFGRHESDSIDIDKLVRLASDILNRRSDMHISLETESMSDIIKVGTSAGGARAKAVIAWNEHTGDIRSGQIQAGRGYGHWLIKFDGVHGNGDKEGSDEPQHTRIEYAYYLMARDAGINMNECRLFEENGLYHFLTRRFDRNPETGQKLHMQSLGAIAHFDYNQSGAYSYELAAQIMRRLWLTSSEIAQFYRRMVFNVLARNQDDHVKNIAFLMDRTGHWSLAPAYDLTYAYAPGGRWTGSHQMRINGKQKDITREDLLNAAHTMGLKKTAAEDAIAAVLSSLEKWYEFARLAHLRETDAARIAKQFVEINI